MKENVVEKVVTNVAQESVGGMKVVGISAGATILAGCGIYFGGKFIVNKARAIIYAKKHPKVEEVKPAETETTEE